MAVLKRKGKVVLDTSKPKPKVKVKDKDKDKGEKK